MVRFLDPEIVKMDDSFSGSRNRQNGAISGSRNRQNGRQILYDSVSLSGLLWGNARLKQIAPPKTPFFFYAVSGVTERLQVSPPAGMELAETRLVNSYKNYC